MYPSTNENAPMDVLKEGVEEREDETIQQV